MVKLSTFLFLVLFMLSTPVVAQDSDGPGHAGPDGDRAAPTTPRAGDGDGPGHVTDNDQPRRIGNPAVSPTTGNDRDALQPLDRVQPLDRPGAIEKARARRAKKAK